MYVSLRQLCKSTIMIHSIIYISQQKTPQTRGHNVNDISSILMPPLNEMRLVCSPDDSPVWYHLLVHHPIFPSCLGDSESCTFTRSSLGFPNTFQHSSTVRPLTFSVMELKVKNRYWLGSFHKFWCTADLKGTLVEKWRQAWRQVREWKAGTRKPRAVSLWIQVQRCGEGSSLGLLPRPPLRGEWKYRINHVYVYALIASNKGTKRCMFISLRAHKRNNIKVTPRHKSPPPSTAIRRRLWEFLLSWSNVWTLWCDLQKQPFLGCSENYTVPRNKLACPRTIMFSS